MTLSLLAVVCQGLPGGSYPLAVECQGQLDVLAVVSREQLAGSNLLAAVYQEQPEQSQLISPHLPTPLAFAMSIRLWSHYNNKFRSGTGKFAMVDGEL
mmetsp:Transcript_36140/g.81785  ORF Transcript_36140/g.81785 Transcript_36140/m.81785 type:complete len:98 (+) Transcript_36140:529-822(+)